MIRPRHVLYVPVFGILLVLQLDLHSRSHQVSTTIPTVPLQIDSSTPRRGETTRNSSHPVISILSKDHIDAQIQSRVNFRRFLGDPRYHNQSVSGELLPGAFFDRQVFLIGARLTTSYVPEESQQVHVDVFGFPGDSVAPGSETFPAQHRCRHQNTVLHNWTLAVLDEVRNNNRTRLYCQLECINPNNNNNEEDSNDNCGDPIEMTLIPFQTGDFNQKNTTFIWRCNVTKHLSKPDIMKHIANSKDESSSVRIKLWYNRYDIAAAMPQPLNTTMSHVTEFDIPLHTAVVGHGGPQIRRSMDKGYFVPQGNQPLQIGHCLSIYGAQAIQYLPEFVQHHKNIGIQQIVVGVEATMDSDELHRAEAVLRPYIDEGFVMLQATGLKTYFNCFPIFNQLHFYHQCLYHFKGIAKYSAFWDLDEYWLPPDVFKVLDNNEFLHDHEAGSYSGSIGASGTRIASRISHQPFETFFVTQSRDAFPNNVITTDPLWLSSNYSKSVSIQDTMVAIEKFYDHHGCGQKWCFHVFPTYTVYQKPNITRTGRILDDFLKREMNSTRTWRKSVVQTRYAMMGGIHVSGSCHYPDDPNFYAFAAEPECLPHIWDSGEAGSLHHFFTMMVARGIQPGAESLVDDEYLRLYAATVSMQLDRNSAK